MDATSPISKSTNESETTIKVKESPNTKGGKESLKLRITTNHVDGTSRIVSNNNSLTTNHNHVIKEKDGSGSLNSKHGGSPDKKDSKTSNANGSHGEKNKEHKNNSSSTPKSTSTPSSKPKDSNSKQPKENNHSLNNSSSKDEKHKENSVSKTKDVSKVKDGSNNHHNNSINKPKVSGTPNSTSKPSGHSKTPSSSVKPKEGGSSKPKEGSSSSDSKQKDGSGSKNTSSTLSSKPKTSSSSTPADKGKTSSSHSTSSKSKESSSKTPSSSTSSSTKPSEKKPSSGSSGNGSSLNKSADKSTSESKSKKVEVTPVKEKQKDKENHNVKDSSKVKVKEESKEKLKEESKEKLKETKKENKQIKKEESSPVKVKVENVKDDKKHVSKVKEEQMSDDDIPLAARIMSQDKKKKVDKDGDGDWEDDEPLKKKMKREASTRKRKVSEDSDDEPISKKVKKTVKKESKQETVTATVSSTKRKKKAEEEQEVWKWWEEEKLEDGVKWKTLEHKGPVFAPDYEPLPSSVKFFYNKKEMKLSEPAEEVATFYAKLLDHDYTSKEMFNQNFFKDWRKTMTSAERETISDLKKCDFRQMCNYFLQKTEERKAMTKEEKQVIKKQNEAIQNEYGFCIIDGHKEKIGNFKIEPPGLFRGRGEHPKMGRHKHRIRPEDVMINCSKKSKIPSPPKGHKWKEVKHDNTVTWLACWQENIQNSIKYVMLNPSSKLKGEKDWQKYEIARKLKLSVDKIRKQYQQDFRSKEMKVRQRAVAMYFIDKLALRAGNEKEEGETADTVGCCSLRVEHITLDEEKDGMQNVVSFDFLGKDSIRYVNTVAVEKRVFKNIRIFMDHKQPGDDLFDRLNTAILNKHLNELMEGLTAKVFRTFNASKTLQEQLELLTNPNDSIAAKILSYNRANRAVAILCNHQRAVPKTFDKSMGNLQAKIQAKKDEVKKAQKEYKEVKREKGAVAEKKKKALERAKEQLFKLELQATDKEENKQIALGTSKLNYLDPRISVAWCKKFDVPIEKVYNKTQRDKFRWAIEMAGPDFVF